MEITPGPDPSKAIFTLSAEEQDVILDALSDWPAAQFTQGADVRDELLRGFKEAKGTRDLVAEMEAARRKYEEARQKLIAAGLLAEDEESPEPSPEPVNDNLIQHHAKLPVAPHIDDDPAVDDETRQQIEMLSYKAQQQKPSTGGAGWLPGAIPAKRLPRRPPS